MNTLATMAILLTCFVAQAVDAHITPDWTRDARVRKVRYVPDEVVRIIAQRGFATHVELDPTEHILVVAPGDRDGWYVVANRGDHDVYLKPKLAAHDTNLIVRTDRRSYSFDLLVLPLKARFGNAHEMYRVSFVYPDTAASDASIAARLACLQKQLSQPSVVRNAAYSMQVMPHAEDIAPSAVWDDGRFTYIRIPNNRRIPAIFRVEDDDTERVVDKHMDRDVVVVHELARRLVLRLGDEAVGLWNDAFDIDGVAPQHGVTVDGVRRTLRSREHD
ncbi:TrbG/VirB9 family P-type conjugative transfer protein [Burkholderia cenocepacia]|uniref:TrbG/VirB9 family P-type conjugative transfer protein n=1 Tax=Burkholderia cenocepacia TaxID=95486 RepID=UPI00078CBDDF|nr:TrbG/VirB9 family P-type conjugative transfer protein [Burkholderia cenocepacia]AMU09118.1 type IV secretion system protein VirB9 [Burkholderia cenocepacia]MBN3503209.1 TrbG/VirB9 family P-type conjugative transfer protein [Burkholderia cenocepacia]MCO1394284.1 TrbG/VirB9 family P-type conjugative transfer protein [Burkholderia cenocepacia]MCO1404900.1 TrbG/VirB9 family P-type conjugative transfer protein [Burkholderia cenocepacia]MCW3662840.1 TrbG/VirB9 family P-type conjugative transfer p